MLKNFVPFIPDNSAPDLKPRYRQVALHRRADLYRASDQEHAAAHVKVLTRIADRAGFYDLAEMFAWLAEEHSASEISDLFSFLPDMLPDFQLWLGWDACNNAKTIPGLLRWILERYGYKFDYTSRRFNGERQQVYWLDAEFCARFGTYARALLAAESKTDKPAKETYFVKKHVAARRGYVYLLSAIHDPTLFKIGCSSNPDNRLKTFNVKLPFPVEYDCLIATDDMYALESELHAQFADKRLDGEWFRLSADDVDYIRQLARKDE